MQKRAFERPVAATIEDLFTGFCHLTQEIARDETDDVVLWSTRIITTLVTAVDCVCLGVLECGRLRTATARLVLDDQR